MTNPARTTFRAHLSPGRLWLAVALGLVLVLVKVVFAAATINANSSAGGFPCGSNWSNAGAWDLGRAPITGDDVVFKTSPPNGTDTSNYDLAASVQLRSVTVNNGP